MRRRRTLSRLALLAAVATIVQPPAHAADPQPYDVTVAPTGDGAIDAALHDSSTLISLRTSAPVGPFALVTRAQGDVRRLQTALHSFGYYDGHATVRIDGRALDDPALPDALAAKPAGSVAAVTVTVERGPVFHLRRVTVDGPISEADRAKLGIAPGDPAIAVPRAGGAGQPAGVAAEHRPCAGQGQPAGCGGNAGRPRAGRHLPRRSRAARGYRRHHGGRAEGHQRQLRPPPAAGACGELYDPASIERARQDLSAERHLLLRGRHIPDHLAPDGTIPLTFTVTERPRHAVSFNVAYSTDTGPTGGATFTYRNVFGNAETLTLGAAITQAETGAEIKRPATTSTPPSPSRTGCGATSR